jgi:hypothetical protein
MSLRKAHDRRLAGFESHNHADWVENFWFVQLADTQVDSTSPPNFLNHGDDVTSFFAFWSQIGMLASISDNGITTSATDFDAELQMLQLAIDFINGTPCFCRVDELCFSIQLMFELYFFSFISASSVRDRLWRSHRFVSISKSICTIVPTTATPNTSLAYCLQSCSIRRAATVRVRQS